MIRFAQISLIAAGLMMAGAAEAGDDKRFTLVIAPEGTGFSAECTLERRGGEETLRLEGEARLERHLVARAVTCRVTSTGSGSVRVELASAGGSRSTGQVSGHAGTAIVSGR